MNKKCISILTLFALLFGCITLVAAEENEDSITFSIKSTEDFLTFAENCRLDSYSQNLVVTLESDIDISGAAFNGIPIFCGTFDGQGHSISGLNLISHGSTIGLFRYLTETAVVTDLNVSGSISPKGVAATVGGIVGSNAGSITGCTFSGTLSGTDELGGIAGINTKTGSIDACSVSGNISGNHFVGGIVGRNNGSIQNCVNSAQINTDHKQNNVNLSDITIDTLTGSESANTVTDIGGIAGTSSGYIRFCTNNANIGYNHIGYNIGGIAGSQIGYLADCENTGIISGRKEIGGIVGQLEPAIAVTYSTDTLQILEGQLNTLSSLATSITANLNTAASGIESQIVMIQGQIESAKDTFSALQPDPDNNSALPDVQAITDTVKKLTEILSSISGSLNSIMNYTENASWALNRDLKAMTETINSMQQTIGNASDNLGGSISDASDEDTDSDLTAKVERCSNIGDVNGDLNCGGIAGAVCMENDLDPEEDIMLLGDLSLNFAGTYRAVIKDCRNTAPINGKKQYIGGVAGLATLGLIRSCTNTGTLYCPNADYVGGIAGFSDGSIRQCSAKTQIEAVRFAGGIVGSGHVISDSRSIVSIEAQENIGAIAGLSKNNDSISACYYLPVATDIGGIDGISYDTCAQPLEQSTFLELEGIEDFFKNYQVVFEYEDGTQESITLKTGELLTVEHIPEIPAKAGYKGYWNGINDALNFDTLITVTYDPNQQVIQSVTLRENGLPILLASGSFSETDQLTLEKVSSLSVEKAIETWTVSAPTETTSYRYLPPEEIDIHAISVLVSNKNGEWKPAEHTIDGRYLVFGMESGSNSFCIIPAEKNYTPLLLWTGVVILLIITVAVCIIVYRKKRSTPQSAQAQ